MRWKPGTAVILGLLGIAAAFFTSYSYQAITAVAPYERIEGQPTIVIDAGHGDLTAVRSVMMEPSKRRSIWRLHWICETCSRSTDLKW